MIGVKWRGVRRWGSGGKMEQNQRWRDVLAYGSVVAAFVGVCVFGFLAQGVPRTFMQGAPYIAWGALTVIVLTSIRRGGEPQRR